MGKKGIRLLQGSIYRLNDIDIEGSRDMIGLVQGLRL